MKRGTRVRLLGAGGYVWSHKGVTFYDVYGIVRGLDDNGADIELHLRSDDSILDLTMLEAAYFFTHEFVEEQI